MKCVICRNGTLQLGATTVTITRDELTLVVKDVPALRCDNCGEEYVDQSTTAQLMKTANEATLSGVQVDVRRYIAA